MKIADSAVARLSQPYPEAPSIGSARQQRELRQQTRDAVTDSNPRRRVQKLLKLRDLVRKIHREESYRSTEERDDEIPRFIAETAYVAIFNGDHSRGKGGIGSMPNAVTDMPELVPQEMVALRITEPRHWVEALYPEMTHNSTSAGKMAKAAGGFETGGGPYPSFMHIYEALKWTAGSEIVASNKYDGLIKELMSANRLAAALHLTGIARPALQGPEFFALRRQLLEMVVHYHDAAALHRLNVTGAQSPPLPFDETTKQMLLELAQRPEWSVHLYVLSFMAKGTTWYDQKIIDRIAAHKNPVSMRFLAAKGMIEPESGPQPEEDK